MTQVIAKGDIAQQQTTGPAAGTLVWKAAITVAADFPTLALVQTGWVYTISADVTDNDPTKTCTSISFVSGQEIVWNTNTWAVVGEDRLWAITTVSVLPLESRDIEAYTGKAVKTDTVSEKTAGAGVTIDGVKHIDNRIDVLGFNSLEKETADRTSHSISFRLHSISRRHVGNRRLGTICLHHQQRRRRSSFGLVLDVRHKITTKSVIP